MKNVIIISSTPRKGGNSERLCEEFSRGAIEADNNVEIIHLRDYNLGYCRGCYSCNQTGKCFQNDGMNEIAQKLKNADVIVLATPVYFYSMSGQLKVFIDRLVPHYLDINAEVYLFCTAWDSDKDILKNCIESMRGLTRDCFENCQEMGTIICGGVEKRGEIEGREELKEAYEMGLNC